MAKPRHKRLYAVVKTKRPHITHLEIYGDTDVKLNPGEALWEVDIKPVKCVRIKREPLTKRGSPTERR